MLTNQQILKVRKVLDGEEQRSIFKLLSDANRYHIVQILVKLTRVSVSNFSKILNISIPLASQHLKILVHGKILEKEKKGQRAYYRFAKNNLVGLSIIKKII